MLDRQMAREKKIDPRTYDMTDARPKAKAEGFDILVASEIMLIACSWPLMYDLAAAGGAKAKIPRKDANRAAPAILHTIPARAHLCTEVLARNAYNAWNPYNKNTNAIRPARLARPMRLAA